MKGGIFMPKLQQIGLTDFCFKELIHKRPDYLLLLVNGICNLKLKESDIEIGIEEERGELTLKTVQFDIKVVSQDILLDIEAQNKKVSLELNEHNEYSYDVSREFYYLSILHSKNYQYRELGYRKKKSIVIFIYAYDLLCESPIQELSMHNKTKNIDYDDMLIYRVSLAKIPEASKIEVERALKLLSEIELDNYLNDDSTIIKEAANMLVHYDKSEEAARIREAKLKDDFEKKGHFTAGMNEGIQIGKREGKQEATIEIIKTMHKNGANEETIAKMLSLDLEYVKKVLSE